MRRGIRALGLALAAGLVLGAILEAGAQTGQGTAPAPDHGQRQNAGIVGYDATTVKELVHPEFGWREEALGRNVEVTGRIHSWVDSEGVGSKYFYLMDNERYWIKVLFVGKPQAAGTRVRLRGQVVVDPNPTPLTDDRKEPPTIMVASHQVAEVKGRTTTTGGEVTPPKKDELDLVVLALIVLAGMVFVVLVVILVMVLGRSTKTQSTSRNLDVVPAGPTDGAATRPVRRIEGEKTETFEAPKGTLALMPGRFEVHGDAAVPVIRLYKLPAKDGGGIEYTFGRLEGNPYQHIRLKSDAVSRNQAKLVFRNNGYELINYSDVNPTVVNGRTLGAQESVEIADNDVIEMGDVTLVYHETRHAGAPAS